MLKLREIETMKEYYRINSDGEKISCKVRFNEKGCYQYLNIDGEWKYSYNIYNELMNSTFEPCEWVPKIGETYYCPCYEGYEDKLTNATEWSDSFYDNRIKRNVGIYRTKEEAHAKSIEIGWTL